MKRIFYLLTIVMAVAGGSLTVRAQAVYPTAKTPTNSFAKLVAEDNVYEKVTVNLDKGTVYADGEKTSASKVEITNNFQTKRIIAAVTELPQTYGAEKSAKGETAYIIGRWQASASND